MGSFIKGITGAIIGKKGAKKAYQAQLRGMEGAIGEQESIFDDISTSQADLRDQNISDIEGLASSASQDYDSVFDTLNNLLENSNEDISALQQGAFSSNEERLLANLDDVLARSQQSFDYAKENLMPYITQGQEAFDKYTQKAMEGFDYKTFDDTFDAPDPFQYDDFDFNYEESPGYQFARDQALNAATNTQAAQGMGLSGATLKALQDRASGLASQDFGNQFNRAMSEYQIGRNNAYQEYGDQYNRDAQQFAQNYDINRANQQGGYQTYLNELNTLSGLGNIGLAGQQDLVGREQNLANFEVQAQTALSQALAQNDFASADAIVNNILRLTGGQGELAMQAVQAKNQIEQAKTSGIIDQRTTAQNNINNIRNSTGSNISNLQMGKGQAEANYQTERAKLQQQLVGGIVDAGMTLGSAALGGAGGFGGAGGLSGAMNGANFGSELSNFGGGQTFSPQSMNFVQTGNYQSPQSMNSMGLSPVNYNNSMGKIALSGAGSGWIPSNF